MDGASDEIRVLHVDDDPDFAEVTASFLERSSERFDVETLSDPRAALDHLAAREVDCVVSDFDMPDQTGIELLETVHEQCPDVPFILFTGKGSEEVASEAISAGVTDYIQKKAGTSHYDVLANRITNVVERRRARTEASESERRLRTIAENANDILWQFSADWSELLFVNSPYEEVWGRSIEELRERPRSFLAGVHPDDRPLVRRSMDRLSAGEPVDVEFRVNAEEEFGRWVWVQAEPVHDDDGEVDNVVGFARDVTDRKEHERERETTIEFLLRLYELATDDERTVEEKVTQLLEAGPETLGLPYGHLTRIDVEDEDDESGTQTIVQASGDHELLQPGESCPLSRSYCRRTIRTDGLFEVHDARAAGWADDPAYETFELGSYIGTTVTVDGELHGTVFFASSAPREEPFTDTERMYVRLLGELVSYELERGRA